MLFVLEGCDGSGKSTVAYNLKNVLPGAEIVHCTRFTPNDMDFFESLIKAADHRDIIADRFCYGQFIYQTAKERNLSDDDLTRLEVMMLEHNVRVIHVAASVDEIENRLTFRGEKTDIPVDEICDRYLCLFENTLIKPYVWWTGSHE